MIPLAQEFDCADAYSTGKKYGDGTGATHMTANVKVRYRLCVDQHNAAPFPSSAN
jgi:hypothetical protein